jgi:protein-arginine kinase activator protein McsA
MEAFNDPEFIALIEEIKRTDPDKFMDLVLNSLKTFPDYAVEDNVPVETKVNALEIVLKHFEIREDYEDCAFIRDLQKRIEDAKEG